MLVYQRVNQHHSSSEFRIELTRDVHHIFGHKRQKSKLELTRDVHHIFGHKRQKSKRRLVVHELMFHLEK
jgi:hypothetical protein